MNGVNFHNCNVAVIGTELTINGMVTCLRRLNSCTEDERKEYDLARQKYDEKYEQIIAQALYKRDKERFVCLITKDTYVNVLGNKIGYADWRIMRSFRPEIWEVEMEIILEKYKWEVSLRRILENFQKNHFNRSLKEPLEDLMDKIPKGSDRNLVYRRFANSEGVANWAIRRIRDYDARRVAQPVEKPIADESIQDIDSDTPIYFGLTYKECESKFLSEE